MNESEFPNAHEYDYAYAPGENRHGPNMENYAGSTAIPSGTNVSGVKTSTMVDTYYIYSFDGKMMAEYDHDGNCVKEYIYMGSQLIAEYQPQTSKYYYYASDQINSTRVVLDDNADIVHSSAYGPYGQVLDNITTTYEPKLKFSGKEREGYSDLDYFGARYYDHQSFRFNSIDPIINKAEALVNPQLWNLYSYCRNNPITYLDPDGRNNRKPGKTSPDRWPDLPKNLGGKKKKWDSKGYWKGKNGRRLTWDSRSHGAGVDRGEGVQDGHWDDETSNERWDRDGNPLRNITKKTETMDPGTNEALEKLAQRRYMRTLLPYELVEVFESPTTTVVVTPAPGSIPTIPSPGPIHVPFFFRVPIFIF